MNLEKEKIRSLKALLETAREVVVAAHTHPDGDALGSTAALCLYVKEQLGRPVTCILPDTPPENLDFLRAPSVPYFFYDKEPGQALAAIQKADLIVLLDCNAFSRTEGLLKALEPENARIFSGAVGTSLLAGMTTDTNNFANSVYPSTFRMASELIAAGADRDALLDKLYRSYRENRVRLMGYMQNEGLHILEEGAAYMILTRDIQERFGLREGESEGLVNVPLSIGKVRLSVLLKEDAGHFRVSVRSKKGTSAQNLAQRFFHGGGHENAAGGKLFPGQDFAPGKADEYLRQTLKDYLR